MAVSFTKSDILEAMWAAATEWETDGGVKVDALKFLYEHYPLCGCGPEPANGVEVDEMGNHPTIIDAYNELMEKKAAIEAEIKRLIGEATPVDAVALCRGTGIGGAK